MVSTAVDKTKVPHPAKFSEEIIRVIASLVPPGGLVLDPMAGIGRIHRLDNVTTIANELEFEWAVQGGPRSLVGNALCLPFCEATFDVVCVSPVYGNRVSDCHEAKDQSKRHTYRHYLGRKLHKNNSGQLQWGNAYRSFHTDAWIEIQRVLKPGGWFILNTSDHYRNWKIQEVTKWHHDLLGELGFTLQTHLTVQTPRNRHGENNKLRVDHESVATFIR